MITTESGDDLHYQQLRDLLEEAGSQLDSPILAQTVLDRFYQTDTRPALLSCDDNQVYVVKGLQAYKDVSRSIITDHIVARLGVVIGASVGQPKLVAVPAELIELDVLLDGFIPGVAHATQYIPDCVDGMFEYAELPENKPRFALFALLYGWCVPSDRQFLYEKFPPRLAYSVDHGHFFPGSIGWNIATLRAATNADLDDFVAGNSGMRNVERYQALQTLDQVEDSNLALAVSAAQSEWGISQEERVELLHFLIRRRTELLALRP
jgi:hypothetical protein